MGKNHRRQKTLKEEKAKVKLKQSKTKFLPKGQNVTDTSFKIKPIVLLEQLKLKDTEHILSKRKLNVKDLLSRIKHYNENVRYAACEELSEMIKIFTEEIVQQHLSQICLAIGSLMQDRERKVRKAAAKCIQVILEQIATEKIVPFFEIFSTNLRCAMTNIDKNIQEDSLLFLDCFIKGDGALIKKTSQKLLPDFLSLISKLRSDSQLGRTLTLNLGSKITSIAWRIKVLSRLHAVLQIILDKQYTVENNQDTLSNVSFNALENSRFPVYNQTFNRVLNSSEFDLFSNRQNGVFHRSMETLNKHILTLIPLLYETWLEVMPERKVAKSSTESTILNEETAALLSSIMNTLFLLWHYIKQIDNEDINVTSVFMSNEGKQFLKHILSDFPYSQLGGRTKKTQDSTKLKILEHNPDQKCIHENLLVCFLYLVLHVHCTHMNLKKETVPIFSYITKLFFQKNYLGEDNIQCIIKFLEESLNKNWKKWQKSGVDLHLLLDNTIIFYDHGNLKPEEKLQLFQILTNVVDNEYFNKSLKYQNWLSNLPSILCNSQILDTTISALLKLSRKNCAIFHKALVKKFPDIVENLDKLEIVLTCDAILEKEESVKRNLVNIFYYIPKDSLSDWHFLRDYICNRNSLSYKKYFEFVFAERGIL